MGSVRWVDHHRHEDRDAPESARDSSRDLDLAGTGSGLPHVHRVRRCDMPEYGRFCPISLGSEVLADRWTPMIMRELVIGNTRFNDIARGLPGISRSLLVQRLRHLERKGVLERWPLAERPWKRVPPHAGRQGPRAGGRWRSGRWAVQWLYQDIDPADIDAVTLMWWMHRHIDCSTLPPGRVVVQFDHTEPERDHGVGGARPRRAVGVHPASRLRRRRHRHRPDACARSSLQRDDDVAPRARQRRSAPRQGHRASCATSQGGSRAARSRPRCGRATPPRRADRQPAAGGVKGLVPGQLGGCASPSGPGFTRWATSTLSSMS